MKALIDGDILVYRIGFTTEEEEEWVAEARLDKILQEILVSIGSEDYEIYLSDSTTNNFRYRIYNGYKANRKDAPKPKHYDFLKETLVVKYDASITPEQEADDALGINQTDDSIIVTIDKDLDQIPGWHFNFVKQHLYKVEPFEGLKWFYQQLIQGDITENVKGVQGMGPKKTEALLKPCKSEDHLFLAAYGAYRTWLEKEWKVPWDEFKEKQLLNLMLINGQLLKIRTKADEIWTFPESVTNMYPVPLLAEHPLSSTQQMQEETTPCMEPTGQENSG